VGELGLLVTLEGVLGLLPARAAGIEKPNGAGAPAMSSAEACVEKIVMKTR
jgi:hypothetical protein